MSPLDIDDPNWDAPGPPHLVTAQRVEFPKLRIEGTWLVEEVGYHTCGQGVGGHHGAHEPGCGLTPVVNLAGLPGFAELAALASTEGPEQ